MAGETLRIGKQEIPIKRKKIDQGDLRFDPKNPRMFTWLNLKGDDAPCQAEIQAKLQKMDHVNILVQSIEAMGGLLDAIIVVPQKDGTYKVAEGNSRLAAYRKLQLKSPSLWNEMDCIVLPEDISDELVFVLLGQYHIVGRKDWSPFEQAGYLYRRKIAANVGNAQMAAELGITENSVAHMIKVFEYMQTQNDITVDSWSYYDEALKSKHITDKMKSVSGFETKLISDIKKRNNTGIEKAREIRDLAAVCKAGNKTSEKLIKQYVDGAISISECIEFAYAAGDTDEIFTKLNKFRRFLSEIIAADITKRDESAKNKIVFELKKTHSALDTLLKNIK